MDLHLHHHGSITKLAITTTMVGLAMLCLLSTPSQADQGLAVFTDRYTPSACFQYQNKGDMIAGVSDKLWNGGRACGRRYRVRCIGPANTFPNPCRTTTGAVVVTVTDKCDRCNGDINLSRVAFAKIAYLDAGKVRIAYDAI